MNKWVLLTQTPWSVTTKEVYFPQGTWGVPSIWAKSGTASQGFLGSWGAWDTQASVLILVRMLVLFALPGRGGVTSSHLILVPQL